MGARGFEPLTSSASRKRSTPELSARVRASMLLEGPDGLRRGPELNRCTGFCRPLPNHSATPPNVRAGRARRSGESNNPVVLGLPAIRVPSAWPPLPRPPRGRSSSTGDRHLRHRRRCSPTRPPEERKRLRRQPVPIDRDDRRPGGAADPRSSTGFGRAAFRPRPAARREDAARENRAPKRPPTVPGR